MHREENIFHGVYSTDSIQHGNLRRYAIRDDPPDYGLLM